jgi:hypothetical protein
VISPVNRPFRNVAKMTQYETGPGARGPASYNNQEGADDAYE